MEESFRLHDDARCDKVGSWMIPRWELLGISPIAIRRFRLPMKLSWSGKGTDYAMTEHFYQTNHPTKQQDSQETKDQTPHPGHSPWWPHSPLQIPLLHESARSQLHRHRRRANWEIPYPEVSSWNMRSYIFYWGFWRELGFWKGGRGMGGMRLLYRRRVRGGPNRWRMLLGLFCG